MDETSNPKDKIQKKLFRRLIPLLALLLLSAGGLVGWLVTRSLFWAGLLLGLCPGTLLGIPTGFLLMAWFAVNNPEEFNNILKG